MKVLLAFMFLCFLSGHFVRRVGRAPRLVVIAIAALAVCVAYYFLRGI